MGEVDWELDGDGFLHGVPRERKRYALDGDGYLHEEVEEADLES